MAISKVVQYYIAHDALIVLTWIPTVVIFFCTLCLSRRRGDPSRGCFTYMKAAFAFFSLALFLELIAYSLTVAHRLLFTEAYTSSSSYYYNDYASPDLIFGLAKAASNIFALNRFVECVAEILVFLSLVTLTCGVGIVQNGLATKSDRIYKFTSYAMAALIGILALVSMALRFAYYGDLYGTNFYTNSVDNGDVNTSLDRSARDVDFAYVVFVFALSVSLVANSIIVVIRSKGDSRVSKASALLLSCAIVWLVRTTYEMVYIIQYIGFKKNSYPDYDIWIEILDVIFGIWPLFVILIILFALSTMKNKGLWSTGNQPYVVGHGQNIPPNPAWQPGYTQASPTSPMMQQQQQFHQGWHQPQGHAPTHQHVSSAPWPQQSPPPPQGYFPAQQQPAPHSVSSQSYAHEMSEGTRSPPPPGHSDAMGLNHQANGTPPQGPPQSYEVKH